MRYSLEQQRFATQPELHRLRTRDGSLFVTDVSTQLTEDLWRQHHMPLPRSIVPQEHFLTPGLQLTAAIVEAQPSASALHAVTMPHWLALKGVRGQFGSDKRQGFNKKYGITDEDNARFSGVMAGQGLSDPDFSWHFAPALANSVTLQMVQDGEINVEQQQGLTLHDWANIIGSGWFSALIHRMAYTRFGTYGQFGTRHQHYQAYGLEKYLREVTNDPKHFRTDLFNFSEAYEPEDGYTYKVATLSDNCKASLQSRMKKDDDTRATGCPAARHNFSLDVDTIDNDRHVQALVDRGQLAIKGTANALGHRQASLELSAIDHALAAQADLLDRYAYNYGTPHLYFDDDEYRVRVRHHHVPPTNALRYRAQPADE